MRMACDAELECAPRWRIELAGPPANVVPTTDDQGEPLLAAGCGYGWLTWCTPLGVVLRRDWLVRKLVALVSRPPGVLAVTEDGEVLHVEFGSGITWSAQLGARVMRVIAQNDGVVVLTQGTAFGFIHASEGSA
jgi:hypothetical protein